MYTSPTSATMITSPLLAKQLKVAAVSDSEPESYLLDHLKFMQTQEKQYQVQGDYLLSSHCIVTTTDRRTMCDWSYTVVDACNIEREMACIGISYFDRFMSTASIIGGGSKVATEALHSRRTFQLVYIACLVIALKCRGGMQVDANFVSETICRNQYESDEINDMECEVLRALTWKLNGPSPHEFVDGIIQLLPSMKKEDDDKEDTDESLMMKTLTKLAKTRVEELLLDHRSMNKTSSSIAFTALLSALRETRAVEALHPLNVMAWMSRIGQVCCGTGETMRNVFGLIEGLGDMMKPPPFLRTVSSLSQARSISSEEEDNDYEHSNARRPLKYSTLKRRYEDLYHHTYGEQSMYSCDTISSSEHRQQRARSFSPKFRRTQSDGSSSSSATFTRGCLFGSSFDSIGSF